MRYRKQSAYVSIILAARIALQSTVSNPIPLTSSNGLLGALVVTGCVVAARTLDVLVAMSIERFSQLSRTPQVQK